MKILAVDPGYTTGLCMMEYDGNPQGEVLYSDQLVWDQRFDLMPLITSMYPNVVVVEDFHLYAHKSQAQINNSFPSVRVIGIIDLICYLKGIPMHLEPASSITKVAILPEHLPHLKRSEHCRDAYKHSRFHALVRLGYANTKNIPNASRSSDPTTQHPSG